MTAAKDLEALRSVGLEGAPDAVGPFDSADDVEGARWKDLGELLGLHALQGVCLSRREDVEQREVSGLLALLDLEVAGDPGALKRGGVKRD